MEFSRLLRLRSLLLPVWDLKKNKIRLKPLPRGNLEENGRRLIHTCSSSSTDRSSTVQYHSRFLRFPLKTVAANLTFLLLKGLCVQPVALKQERNCHCGSQFHGQSRCSRSHHNICDAPASSRSRPRHQICWRLGPTWLSLANLHE